MCEEPLRPCPRLGGLTLAGGRCWSLEDVPSPIAKSTPVDLRVQPVSLACGTYPGPESLSARGNSGGGGARRASHGGSSCQGQLLQARSLEGRPRDPSAHRRRSPRGPASPAPMLANGHCCGACGKLGEGVLDIRAWAPGQENPLGVVWASGPPAHLSCLEPRNGRWGRPEGPAPMQAVTRRPGRNRLTSCSGHLGVCRSRASLPQRALPGPLRDHARRWVLVVDAWGCHGVQRGPVLLCVRV